MALVPNKREQLYVCPRDNATQLVRPAPGQSTRDFLSKLSVFLPCPNSNCNDLMVKHETLVVRLVCTAGHTIGWPINLFPRPDRCQTMLDPSSTVIEICNQKMYDGFRLIEDYEDPNVTHP